MRIFILQIFCIMVSNVLSLAQELSVELSIKWRKEKMELNIPTVVLNDSVVLPMLKFTYRNLTGENIYFRNIYTDKSIYPRVTYGSLINTQMDLANRIKVHSIYKGEFYQVKINEFWTITEQGLDVSKAHELHFINDELGAIYTVLETQQSLNELGIQKQLYSFGYLDKEFISYREAQRLIFAEREKKELAKAQNDSLTNYPVREDEIIRKYEDQLIFLKAGEIYEKEVSLIGFYLLNGKYEFSIPKNSLPDSIIGEDGKKINLPKLINGYHLYKENFLTNTVIVEIK